MSKAIDVNELPDEVLSDILDNIGSEDPEDVSQMTAGECFDRFLTWNGICGYSGMILDAVDGIRAADTIQEIRELVNPAVGAEIDADGIFTDVVNCFDHHGHMGHELLKIVGSTLRLATNPTGRALALLKIKEVLG